MRWLAAALVVLFMAGPASLRAGDTITVAAAVSLKESISDIARSYEAQSGDRVDLTFGSSGQLAAQIKSGAPIDAFISAANQQIDDLAKSKLIDEPTRRVVAGNSLVLIAAADAKNPPESFANLADPAAAPRVAIGEPKTVPAGMYAQQALRSIGVFDKLGDRLIFGANVRQVLDYVIRGEVAAGIVYRTDALEAGQKVRIIATAEAKWHEPIVYPAAVIASSARRDAAKRFLEYVSSEKARSVLHAHGFTTPG